MDVGIQRWHRSTALHKGVPVLFFRKRRGTSSASTYQYYIHVVCSIMIIMANINKVLYSTCTVFLSVIVYIRHSEATCKVN